MRRRARWLAALGAAALGVGLAAVVGVALATTFTFAVARNTTVTNFNTHQSKLETIVTAAGGFAVYTLSGDSKSHPECRQANGCLQVWPPVTVSAAKKPTKSPGIKGKLGTWHRSGFTQLTLAGHPLYLFSFDKHTRHATGEAIHSFGGTWHVVAADPPTAAAGTAPPMPATTTTTTPTTLIPNPYPGT